MNIHAQNRTQICTDGYRFIINRSRVGTAHQKIDNQFKSVSEFFLQAWLVAMARVITKEQANADICAKRNSERPSLPRFVIFAIIHSILIWPFIDLEPV
ncbi:MAG: hypothetical protein BA865_11230 [Desulfobacterales bacterium S5133MH4]|nr:MAG: hypothetical protein BA865_11230 [Desulfobacterales bacterium S5133MH4]